MSDEKQEALEYMKSRDDVNKTSFIGVSLGAEIVLLIAAILPLLNKSHILDSIVPISPIHLLTQRFSFQDPSFPVAKLWEKDSTGESYFEVIKTEVAASLPFLTDNCSLCFMGAWNRAFDVGDPSICSTFIPVEYIEAHTFLASGDQDVNWPSAEASEFMIDRKRKAVLSHRSRGTSTKEVGIFKHESYHGAGHLLEPCYSPCCSESWHKIARMTIVWGGETRTHAVGQFNFWTSLLSFLQQTLDAVPRSPSLPLSSSISSLSSMTSSTSWLSKL